MSALTVRAYNVRFGDAILVSVPDRDPRTGHEQKRHILIDVGNVLGGEGGKDDVFEPIVSDIRRRTENQPIDLYVMTHEHLDHVQGLPLAASRAQHLDVDFAWLTASAGPGYYKRHPEAETKRLQQEAAYYAIGRHLAANPAAETPWMKALMLNNHPSRTRDCVRFLRTMATKKTRFIHRGIRPQTGTHHPFHEAKFRILAPEKDTSSYYGRMRPLMVAAATENLDEDENPWVEPSPPPGVDRQGFRRLLESWGSSIAGNVLAIDRAANNTSVVFLLEWRGWKLLFTGDAEQKSWRMMQRHDLLGPVHFLKIGHHGSHNATPPDSILESIFPVTRPDRRKRVCLLSSFADTYGNVPDRETLGRLEARSDQVLRTDTVAPGKSVSVAFRG